MGAWNYNPWENDEAADWFQEFWKQQNFAVLINEISQFDPAEERYDAFRAACYLLQTLGNPYIWPTEYLAQLKPLIEQAISILTQLIDPPNDEWGFLDMWGDSADVINAVEEQIDALKMRLGELA
ncbi:MULTISPECIES: DUF4259 domain-containing protein [Pseudomonas]|uniref:DUF4259 domain-containing protein n=1 Tax=Pseudomonas TaxID=286 RepID=UPI000997271D|nr:MULTISPECIES: DUF4259 domain-containing protein [Pseudomonas]OOW05669.1 hypothetical protein MF6394_05690 [Pseudomonas sp. MF6394]